MQETEVTAPATAAKGSGRGKLGKKTKPKSKKGALTRVKDARANVRPTMRWTSAFAVTQLRTP